MGSVIKRKMSFEGTTVVTGKSVYIFLAGKALRVKKMFLKRKNKWKRYPSISREEEASTYILFYINTNSVQLYNCGVMCLCELP